MAAMELWGVVEGGINKETPPGGVMADGQKYERRSIPKKFGVLEFVQYILYVGKMTATKQHTAPWEKSTKSTSKKKKSPLVPGYILQIHHEI